MVDAIIILENNVEVRILDTGFCRSCKADIVWCETIKNKKKIPVNIDLKRAHWATCPQAKTWKNKENKGAKK